MKKWLIPVWRSVLVATAPAALLLAPAAPAPCHADDLERSTLLAVRPADRVGFRELLDAELDVVHIHGGVFEIVASDTERAELEAAGFDVRVLMQDIHAPLRSGGFPSEYVTFAEAEAKLAALAAAYPALTELTSLGTSHEGRDLWALKISDNASADESEPEVLVMGNHHAREIISVIIPLAVADSLLSNYGTDPQYTEWVDERETWIVPVVNPDGFVYHENNWSGFGFSGWRKNRRVNGGSCSGQGCGVDLNRNYPYEWDHDDNGSSGSQSSNVYRGPSAGSEPEVQAIMALMDAREFVFALSYHSYGNLTLWGPGFKPALSEDEDIFAAFGAEVAALNGYTPGNPASGAIYITNGDTDDWAYHAASHPKIFALTPEVGNNSSDGFNPPVSRIPTLVAQGSVPAWKALEFADRPGRLAPPGQPLPDAVPVSTNGNFDVTWSAPTTADTQPALYELVEKTGPSTVTDDLDSGAASWNLGGWSLSGTRSFSGSTSLHSGAGNELNRICLAKEGYVVQPGDQFRFRAWYRIEDDWDYAYAVLSTDGGRSIVNLAGTGTTMTDPNGLNADHGITGNDTSWQTHTYDLGAWVGQTVWLGFRYNTDGGFVEDGIWVDDVEPVRVWATETVLSSSIAGESFAVAGRTDGSYFYTIRGRDAEGDWGYPSVASEVVVSLSTGVAIGAPQGFFLNAGRPNPFTTTSSLRFGLPATSDHRLAVYDVSGRLVRQLSSGPAAAGVHDVSWDGRNREGLLVPSGVYFYILETEAGDLRSRTVLTR